MLQTFKKNWVQYQDTSENQEITETNDSVKIENVEADDPHVDENYEDKFPICSILEESNLTCEINQGCEIEEEISNSKQEDITYAGAVYHINMLEKYFMKNGAINFETFSSLKKQLISTKKKRKPVITDFIRVKRKNYKFLAILIKYSLFSNNERVFFGDFAVRYWKN